jgi:hypothetical protein
MKATVPQWRRLIVIAGVLGLAEPALTLAAGDPTAKECLVGLEDEQERVLDETVSCRDGDVECDADGVENGVCTFRVRACVNLPNVPACRARELRRFKALPRRLGITVTPIGSASVCGAYADVSARLRKNGTTAGRARVLTRVRGSSGRSAVDVDRTIFVCQPPPPCDVCGCPENPDGGPSELRLTVGTTGNDLDIGSTGRSHNFTNVAGATLRYCLSACDAGSNPVCDATGFTGQGSTNGATFGPPLPLFSASVAVCVVNRFEDSTIRAVVDVRSGAFDAQATPLRLVAETYQGTASQVCPRCVNGHCDSGRNAGGQCRPGGRVVVNDPPNVVDDAYDVSADCLPSAVNAIGAPEVVLPLTSGRASLTGSAAGSLPCPGQARHDECGSGSCTVDCSGKPDPKGGINQTCCSSGGGLPCFPTDPDTGGAIVRTGSVAPPTPAWPDRTYPKASDGTLAAVFCVPTSGGIPVDATAGLPGPGALLLSGTMEWTRQ